MSDSLTSQYRIEIRVRIKLCKVLSFTAYQAVIEALSRGLKRAGNEHSAITRVLLIKFGGESGGCTFHLDLALQEFLKVNGLKAVQAAILGALNRAGIKELWLQRFDQVDLSDGNEDKS